MDIRTEIISPANEQYTNSAAGVPGPEAVPLALRAFQEPGGRGELTRERFEGADGLLGDGKRVSLAGEDAGEDGL